MYYNIFNIIVIIVITPDDKTVISAQYTNCDLMILITHYVHNIYRFNETQLLFLLRNKNWPY